MNRGGFKATAAIALLACGCSTTPAIKVRSATTLTPAEMSAVAKFADAEAQFALGNVALALEMYRKASRADPHSTAALVGIARCYDAMRRYDLSRFNYEQALALAPGDTTILAALASSLQVQGLANEADSVRQEIALRTAIAAGKKPVFAEAPAAVSLEAGSVAPAASVTVSLPAAAPLDSVELADAAPSVTVPLPAAIRAEPAPPPPARPNNGARLERLSLGQVALITTGEPIWRRLHVDPPRSAYREASADSRRPALVMVRLLNAARVEGIAGRAHDYLYDLGWRAIEVGDASNVRESSVVAYPADSHVLAKRVAAQFGFPMMVSDDGQDIRVLLGRDALEAPGIRRRG